mmetsp:Transcript_4633/g.8900  ORF Transcript_4633/g.8900 Transcript_4633/m.8900 type:complete len:234 (+) Transcript_4633:2-703(+)
MVKQTTGKPKPVDPDAKFPTHLFEEQGANSSSLGQSMSSASLRSPLNKGVWLHLEQRAGLSPSNHQDHPQRELSSSSGGGGSGNGGVGASSPNSQADMRTNTGKDKKKLVYHRQEQDVLDGPAFLHLFRYSQHKHFSPPPSAHTHPDPASENRASCFGCTGQSKRLRTHCHVEAKVHVRAHTARGAGRLQQRLPRDGSYRYWVCAGQGCCYRREEEPSEVLHGSGEVWDAFAP